MHLLITYIIALLCAFVVFHLIMPFDINGMEEKEKYEKTINRKNHRINLSRNSPFYGKTKFHIISKDNAHKAHKEYRRLKTIETLTLSNVAQKKKAKLIQDSEIIDNIITFISPAALVVLGLFGALCQAMFYIHLYGLSWEISVFFIAWLVFSAATVWRLISDYSWFGRKNLYENIVATYENHSKNSGDTIGQIDNMSIVSKMKHKNAQNIGSNQMYTMIESIVRAKNDDSLLELLTDLAEIDNSNADKDIKEKALDLLHTTLATYVDKHLADSELLEKVNKDNDNIKVQGIIDKTEVRNIYL